MNNYFTFYEPCCKKICLWVLAKEKHKCIETGSCLNFLDIESSELCRENTCFLGLQKQRFRPAAQ